MSVLVLGLVWAALYLPALGDPELRGEEMRRILPAQAMLETGDWVVPRIAGEIYSNKPPLINWAIAAAFALSGSASETTARMVSALSVLLLALGTCFILRRRGEVGEPTALLVAVSLLTTVSIIGKGRLIEIEALFVALFGLAAFLWIRLWTDRRSPWLVWTLPYIPLGLGCLAKGPIHLIFWFLFVIASVWFARERRSFLHLAHAVGIALMGLVSLPWVLLNLRAVGLGEDSVENWAAEIAMRGDFGKFDLERWLTTPFRIVGGYLPWSVPLLYSLWHLKKGHLSVSRNRREEAVIFGSLVSIAFGFFGVCLMPLNTPRYLMPVYPLAALATMALYQRLPDAAKARYEHFGRQALKFLIPLTLLVPPALAFMLWKKGEPFPIATTVAGPLLVVAASTLVFGPWRLKSLFLSTALVIAAGGLGIIPVAQSFQSERNIYRHAAHEIQSRVPQNARIVIFADSEIRTLLTKHLRLLYYLREPVDGIGESGILPQDTALLVAREKIREKLPRLLQNQKITKEESLMIHGELMMLLFLEKP